jgi:hypothetical protein
MCNINVEVLQHYCNISVANEQHLVLQMSNISVAVLQHLVLHFCNIIVLQKYYINVANLSTPGVAILQNRCCPTTYILLHYTQTRHSGLGFSPHPAPRLGTPETAISNIGAKTFNLR